MIRKLIVEFFLFILILQGYSYHFTGNLAHEVIGVAILMGLVIHIAQNRGRFLALFKLRPGRPSWWWLLFWALKFRLSERSAQNYFLTKLMIFGILPNHILIASG